MTPQTDTMQGRFGKRDWLIAAAVAIAVFAAYLATLPAQITGEDSGEFIAAAASWGVCHPPGYPLYTMLAKLATVLLPFGPIALRVNMASAVLGALASAAACLTVIRVTRCRLAGWVAGAALGVSHQFWMLSVVAEVYSLQAFLLASQLLLLAVWSENRKLRYLYVFALLYGLSLTNHQTIAGLAPFYAIYVFLTEPKLVRRPLVLAALLGLFALGLSPYLLLLARSAAHPAINWAELEILRDLWDHAMRKQYEGVTKGEIRTLAGFLGQLGAIFAYGVKQFTWIGAALAAGGLAWQLTRGKGRNAFLWLATLLVSSVAVAMYTNFPATRAYLSANYQFFLPVNVILALWLGLAAAGIVRLTKAHVLAKVALVAFPLLVFAANHFDANKRHYYLNQDLARNLVETLEPDAIVTGTNDLVNFAILYEQVIYGRRTDIELVMPYGPSFFNPKLKCAEDPGPRPDIRDGKYRSFGTMERAIAEHERDYATWQRKSFWGVLQANPDRPIYFSGHEDLEPFLPEWELRPEGFLWRLCRKGSDDWKKRGEEAFAKTTFRNFNTDPEGPLDFNVYRDLSADWIAGHYLYMRGLYERDMGEAEQAIACFAKASDAAPGIRQIQNNTGIAFKDANLWRLAALCFERASDADPGSMQTRFQYALALYQGGRPGPAAALLGQIAAYPRTPTRILAVVADTYALMSRDADARGQQDLAKQLSLAAARIARQIERRRPRR